MAKRREAAPAQPVSSIPGSPPAAAPEKRVQCSVWFLPSIYKQIRHEAIDRGMSVGEVLEEAMHARVMMIQKGTK